MPEHMTEQELERRGNRMVAVAAVCLVLVLGLDLWDYLCHKAADKPEITTESVVEVSDHQLAGWLEAAMAKQEPETAPQAVAPPVLPDPMIEDTYLREDIPLSYDLQAALYGAALEFGVDYDLALAVAEQESNFRNLTGDGGASVGYFQVQPRWWGWLLEEIGVNDLTDPESNFRAGCAILANLLEDNSMEDALSLYNTGHDGSTAYSRAVMGRMGGR